MHARLLTVAIFALSAYAAAASATPRVGDWGFDWLQPGNTRCRRIDSADIARFATCDRKRPGFGIHTPTHACRVNDRSEWILYATKSECQDEFETMQANAP